MIRRIVSTARTIAVVGCSPRQDRPSHGVAKYLRDNGYTIYPVNPAVSEVLGLRAYPSLAEVPARVDIVDVFRQPDAVPEIAEQAVSIGAGALWLQLGVISEDGARLAEDAGLDVVMDRCLRVEHARVRARDRRGR